MQIFDLFDLKRNGVIDFGEFVRSLSIFHPETPLGDKIACKEFQLFLIIYGQFNHLDFVFFNNYLLFMPFWYLTVFFFVVAFRLYDLRGTGCIEREEVCILEIRITYHLFSSINQTCYPYTVWK